MCQFHVILHRHSHRFASGECMICFCASEGQLLALCARGAALMQAEGTAWAKPVVVPSARGDVYPDSESSPLVPAGEDDYPRAKVSTLRQLAIPDPLQPMEAAFQGWLACLQQMKFCNS